MRAVLATAEQAAAKGLSVMTGTQLRREPRASRCAIACSTAPSATCCRCARSGIRARCGIAPRQDGWSDMEWMIRDWVNWNWLSGDHIVEQHIHHLDGMLWVMGKAPVKAVGMGGRVRRQTGRPVRLLQRRLHLRQRRAHAQHHPAGERVRQPARRDAGRHQGQRQPRPGRDLRSRRQGRVEVPGRGHRLAGAGARRLRVGAIRSGTPVNTAKDTAIATLVAIMGRESAYTGKAVTYDELMASTMRLGPRPTRWVR